MSLKELSGDASPKREADSVKIDYSFNNHGYRCGEFDNQEILTLGCSQTEGHALPIHLTWPYLLSQKMDKDYANLAKGGDSAQAQVVKAFQFFKEFHHPKYIFAAFPLTRLDVPLINLSARNLFDTKIGKAMIENRLIQKFSKAPHQVENVLTEEFAIYYNILFIKMLAQYCESNNIKLIWFHYNDLSIRIPKFEEVYKECVPFNNFSLEGKTSGLCHREFAKNQFFDHAADYKYWPPGHWSFHQNIHISEYLYDIVNKEL